MAKKLTTIPTNLTEYPNSFKRQGAFPLDAFSVFDTKEAASTYAKESKIAYVGQVLAVPFDDKCYLYVIKNEAGDLEQITLYNSLADANVERRRWDSYLTGVDVSELEDSLNSGKTYSDSNSELRKSINSEISERFNKDKELQQAISNVYTKDESDNKFETKEYVDILYNALSTCGESITYLTNEIESLKEGALLDDDTLTIDGMGVPNEILHHNTGDEVDPWDGSYDGWTFEDGE